MPNSFCPACDTKINIPEDPDIGTPCSCDACQAELVVVWLNPIELMQIEYADQEGFEGDFYLDNVQKISRKKGENHGNGKTQKKFKENHRNKKEF